MANESRDSNPADDFSDLEHHSLDARGQIVGELVARLGISGETNLVDEVDRFVRTQILLALATYFERHSYRRLPLRDRLAAYLIFYAQIAWHLLLARRGGGGVLNAEASFSAADNTLAIHLDGLQQMTLVQLTTFEASTDPRVLSLIKDAIEITPDDSTESEAREPSLDRGRLGPRTWPPIPHKHPATFHLGKEHTGMLKSIRVELNPHYMQIVDRAHSARSRSEFHWSVDQVKEFDLSVYFPLDVMNGGEKIHHALIMVNGLDEIQHVHYGHYDRIGGYLAPRGIGGILHPSPFHLNRAAFLDDRFRDAYEKPSPPREGSPSQSWPRAPGASTITRIPHKSLVRDGQHLFECFDQTARELVALAGYLKGKPHALMDEDDAVFFDSFFARGESMRVSLMGYSMGGLQSLFAALQEPQLFDRLVLINSGAPIQKLSTKPVGILDDEWNAIVKKVMNLSMPQDILRPDLLHAVLFERPFMRPDHMSEFAAIADRILFIAGGADIVSRTEHLATFVDADFLERSSAEGDSKFGGLNIFQVKGLAHPLQNSAVYDRWFYSLMDTMMRFLQSPDHQPQEYVDVLRELAKIEIDDQPWDHWVTEHKGVLVGIDLNLNLSEILNHIAVDNARAKFLSLYYITKRYFANDSELLRAVDRQRERDGR